MPDELAIKVTLDDGPAQRTPSTTPTVSKGAQVGQPVRMDPSFMSIFKPLAALEGIKKFLYTIMANSQISNAYLGAFGKVFGAAIDMALAPFIPIFNIMLKAFIDLAEWFNGVMGPQLKQLADAIIPWVEKIGEWINRVLNPPKGGAPGQLGETPGYIQTGRALGLEGIPGFKGVFDFLELHNKIQNTPVVKWGLEKGLDFSSTKIGLWAEALSQSMFGVGGSQMEGNKAFGLISQAGNSSLETNHITQNNYFTNAVTPEVRDSIATGMGQSLSTWSR